MFYEVISEEDSLISFVVMFSSSCELRIGNNSVITDIYVFNLL